ncbi:hypothetical protein CHINAEXTREME_17070 [Halobiforma lacisalsi AJ5]|uniref:Winged helix-turn-helix domain-containing protein n=1 Tax=Natronobacterium lacisalsi AJ5 TaxID=358396 RepID=A0A1P8LUB2_NATLA|nr:hypothetical protein CHINAEXTREME_17070 [Halobiforma lacisalsi AJ5]
MKQRHSASWMEQLDDRILEHLDEEPWSSVSVMASRSCFRASKARIRERCQMLARAGLIAPVHHDMYEITTWGIRYLEGEIDADHQPRPVA